MPSLLIQPSYSSTYIKIPTPLSSWDLASLASTLLLIPQELLKPLVPSPQLIATLSGYFSNAAASFPNVFTTVTIGPSHHIHVDTPKTLSIQILPNLNFPVSHTLTLA